MKQSYFSFTFSLVFFLSITVKAQNPETRKKIQLVEQGLVGPVRAKGSGTWSLKERMAHYHVAGLSIAVIHNYKLEWANGYGLTDKSLKIPVTKKTLFQAGSISKSLNAVGVLMLVQTKKISLYSDINHYLTSWKFPYDSIAKNKKVTIAGLLSHSAGLNVTGFSGYINGQSLPSIVQILDGEKPANSPAVRSIFEPGLRHEYSGGGTTITQLIVKDITHQPYDRYMYENVLKALGMNSSTFEQPPTGVAPPLLATGYYENGKEVEGKYHIYPEQAAAGLWTTPSELARYIIEIQKSYQGKSNKVLVPEMTKLMLTPYKDQRAALGVFIDDFNGEKYFEHSGLTYGFYSQYYGSLKGGNGVVVMINSVNDGIVPEVVNSVANVYGFKGLYRSKIEKSIVIEDKVLQSYTGEYALTPEITLTVLKEGKQLFVKLTGQDKIPVFAETQNKFYLKVVDAQLEFVKSSDGKIIKAILYQNGSINNAPRVK